MQSFRERLSRISNDYTNFEPFRVQRRVHTSIVIPVYGEVALFEHCLRSLARNKDISQNRDVIEIVVVNDGCGSDVGERVRSIAAELPVTYVHCNINSGRSVARNIGIANSSNELILFLDSDMMVNQNILQSHWRIHSSVKDACGLGIFEKVSSANAGVWQVRRPNPYNDFRVFRSFKNTPKRETGGECDGVRILEQTRKLKDLGYGRRLRDWTLPLVGAGCELSVMRRNVYAVGGFDAAFEGWGYEDNFFVAKLIVAGAYIIPTEAANCFKVEHGARGRPKHSQIREGIVNRRKYERMLDLCDFPEFSCPSGLAIEVMNWS